MTSTQKSQTGGDGDESFDESHNGHASPLSMSGMDGNDHMGKTKVKFDESTLPDGFCDLAFEGMDWAVDAVNAVMRHPHLCLWARGLQREVFMTYDPAHEHEHSGFVRAVSYPTDRHMPYEYEEGEEIDAGLLNFSQAVNTLYDIIPKAANSTGIERIPGLLVDLEVLNGLGNIKTDHTIFTLDTDDDQHEHYLGWSRSNNESHAIPRSKGQLCNPVEVNSGHSLSVSEEESQAALQAHVDMYRHEE